VGRGCHRRRRGALIVRKRGNSRGASGAAMPVVLTSTLGFDTGSSDEFTQVAREQGEDDESFGISQTPQVFLDHIVGENDNFGRTADMDAEQLERKAANLAWLRQTFAEAKGASSRGVVILTQANPGFENYWPANAKTLFDHPARVGTGADFFAHSFEDEHVGIDGHTHGQHDPGDHGKGQRGPDGGKDRHDPRDVCRTRGVG